MFGFFKKKTKVELLEIKYEKLQKEAYELSKTNRTLSDQKYAEAQAILAQIDVLNA